MRVFGTHRSLYGAATAQAFASRQRIAGRGLLGFRSGLAMATALTLAGCAAPPPPVVIPPAEIQLHASADVNPDARGRASPLTVRIYALKSPGVFQSSDFFSLYEKDLATLGGDMLLREEVLLKPGEQRRIQMKFPADGKTLGVLAAYRDLNQAQWRALQAVDPGKAVQVNIRLGARQVAVDAVSTEVKVK